MIEFLGDVLLGVFIIVLIILLIGSIYNVYETEKIARRRGKW